MILHSNILGSNNEKVVLILHGLYGNLDSWRDIGNFLSQQYCVHLLDLRNHGKSFHSNSHNYIDLVDDILNYVKYHELEDFSIIGHSMGGKAAMYFADTYPKMVEKLVVIDISPRNYKSLVENDSSVNFHLNIISTMKNLDITSSSLYSQIEAEIPYDDKKIKNLILKNLKKDNGNFSWRINLDTILSNLSYILDGFDIENYIDKKIWVESLFIKAANSDYITNNDKKIINFIFSNSKFVEIENAGHWIHVGQPEILKNKILNFLSEN